MITNRKNLKSMKVTEFEKKATRLKKKRENGGKKKIHKTGKKTMDVKKMGVVMAIGNLKTLGKIT